MTNELVMCPRGGRPCTLAHCPTSGCFLSPGSVRIGPNDVEVNVEKIYPAVWVPKHELEHAVKEKVAATQTAQALAAKVDRLQAVCAAAYQLAGAVGAPVRFLDALSDAASDELEARACTADLLPIGPLDCDAVRETRLEFDRALEREKFWMNQHDAREADVARLLGRLQEADVTRLLGLLRDVRRIVAPLYFPIASDQAALVALRTAIDAELGEAS